VGADLDQLEAASNELQAYLNRFAGVQDLTDDLRPGKREYRLRLKPDAGVLGLDARQVSEQLRAAFQGVKIDEFPLGAETYEVNLRIDAGDRTGPADLERFNITGRDGALIPLANLAEVEQVRGWARIHRVDGQRAVTVQGDVDRDLANAQELLGQARAEFIPGLTPLLLEKSLKAQILIPLAASLAFGLVTATVAALFLVPAIYVILDDLILDDFGALGALEAEADAPAVHTQADRRLGG
jgi:multidrug efflux pump subunit AcrB